MINVIYKQKRAFIQYAAAIFVIFSLLTVSFTSFLQYQLFEAKRRELLIGEQSLIKTENAVISNRISRISGDLLYIADCFRLNDNGDGDYSDIEKLWLAFSDRIMIYDQIRFIDADGNEIIRVNHTKSGAVLVDKADLQNKKDRYFFQDTINLDENQIYISKLDLNVENDEIEQPIKPMIRISMPYYAGSQLKGIIMLNYLADDMLNQVRQVASASKGSISMLNSDGYWLFNSEDKDKEWAFMYKDKENVRFSNEFPAEWEVIQSKRDGYQIGENGVFIFSSILTSKVFSQENEEYSCILDSKDWIIISHMADGSDNGALFTHNIPTTFLYTLQKDYYYYIVILFLAVTIAALVVINKNEKEKIKYFSEYDVMTGVYNRRVGFEMLSQLYRKPESKDCMMSICFIDINGLKEVNDALGHEAGDELICSVVAGIKKGIGEKDVIARLGGDEFLIIFSGIDEGRSEEIWKHIVEDFDHINAAENRKYLISVSHGITSFQCNSDQAIDAMVNLADEKMYQEKREIRRNIKILRDNENLQK